MSENKQTTSIRFTGLLAIVFITLKLTGYISWSWWWVLAPLWGPVVLTIPIMFIALVVAWLTTR